MIYNMRLAEMQRRCRKSCRGKCSQLEEVRRKSKEEINALRAENQIICRQTKQPSQRGEGSCEEEEWEETSRKKRSTFQENT